MATTHTATETTTLYVVYYGSVSNHSHPTTFSYALKHLRNNVDLPGPQWWIGRHDGALNVS